MSYVYRGPLTGQEVQETLDRWYASGPCPPARGHQARAAAEGTVKLTWKRTPGAPAGQPADGTFTCGTCRATSPPVPFGGPDWTCGCGRTWNGRGWLVAEPTTPTT